MKNIYKIIIGLGILIPTILYGAIIPTGVNQGSGFINPLRISDRIEASNFIASSTATKSVFPFASSTVLTVTSNLYNTALSNGCLTAVSGLITSTGLACGGAGGSGGGTWSTTTSTVSGRLINFPNNTTDIINVGSNSTTTGKFYYDPNTTKGFMNGSFVVGTAQPTYADDNLSTLDIVSDVNGYSFVGIQNKNAGTIASSDLVFANNKTTITDYYADCGISGGNNTDPLFTGIGGSNAYYCFNTDGSFSSGIGTTTAGADFNWTVSSDGGASYLTSDIKMKLTNSGNLGIGTTSPYAKLSVVGNSGVVAERFTATSTTAFSTFGGRIGISTTSPSQRLEIADGNLSITSASGQGRGLILSTDVMDDGARALIKFLRNNYAAFTGDDHAAQSFNFLTALASTRVYSATVRAYGSESGGFANYIGMTHDGTDGNIITGAGDLILAPATAKTGMGTSTPRGKLEITGDTAVTTNSTVIAPTTSGNRTLWIDGNNIDVRFTNQNIVSSVAHLLLQSAGGAGNVGVGTTSPYAKLSVSGEIVTANINATSTTATSTFAGGLNLINATVQRHEYPTFTYATSTTWTGTTTIPLGISYTIERFIGVKCFTDVGTLNVSFNDGTNRMNMFNASTTVGTVLLNVNNTHVVNEKRYVDIGTPATSPTKISCTVDKIINQ